MNKQGYVDRVSEARRDAEQNPTIEKRRWLASSLGSLGNYVGSEESNYSEAIRHHQEAKSIYHSIGDYDGEAQACFNLGATYEVGLHDKQSAWNYIKQGMELAIDERLREKYEPHYKRLKSLGKIEGWLADD
jgi:tetratricopeptide (TPR) repeat protein